ncbi:MAG TPA: hypothetical protein VMH39_13945, partial [Gemmatimonadaceae bacterium]|nr:hypothetical protein [Gemmatimonadaceae bacterium]
VCQPFIVATLPDTFYPNDIAVNETLAFVSGDDTSDGDDPVIYSVPLDGGAVQVFAQTTDPAYELFAGPSTLYWATPQSIASDSIDAGTVTTIVALDASAIVGFSADPAGAFLYWAEISSTDNLTVWTDPSDAGPQTAIWDGGNQQCGGVEFAPTPREMYWSYQSNNTGPTVPLLVSALGSTAVTATGSVPAAQQLVAQGENLFVLPSYSNEVESLPLAGGGAPAVYTDEAGVIDFFAADPNWLYVADEANTLQAMPFDGGSSVVLDNSANWTSPALAVTSGFIYWVSSGPPVAVMGVATP